MNAAIKAESPDDLVAKFDAALEAIGKDALSYGCAEWDEAQQVWRFLRAVARDADFIRYPLTVNHTSHISPDFMLSLPAAAIGIEASRVTNEKYQRLRNLPGMSGKPHSILHALVSDTPMNNQVLAALADHGAPASVPNPNWDIWRERVEDIVNRKTEIRRNENYHDYGKNWLILWDRLRLPGESFQTHATLLQAILSPYWSKEKVFDMIVLEHEELKEFAVISPNGVKYF